MWFVHPGILAATVGLAFLPILIHLLNRRRYRRLPWAAMMFLPGADRRHRRSLRVRQIVLIALRTLVILLMGATIARPFLSPEALGASLGAPRVDRVLILDDSLSMTARGPDGRTSFETAVASGFEYLRHWRATDGLALVTAAAPAQAVHQSLAHDQQAVAQALDAAVCSARPTDLAGALDRASKILSKSAASPGGREVFVLTDLTRGSLPSRAWTRDPSASNIDRIVFVDCGPPRRTNFAVSKLRCESRLLGRDLPATLSFQVANYSSAPADLELELQVADAPPKSLQLERIAPGSSRRHSVEILLPGPGGHVLTAALKAPAGDVLSADDGCSAAVRVPERIPVLLVEGNASRRRSQRELFYISAALGTYSADGGEATFPRSGSARTSSFFDTKEIAASELGAEILAEYEIVVIGDVPYLPGETWGRIGRYVRGGGGLIYFPGHQAQPERPDRDPGGFSDAAGFPFRLRQYVRVAANADPLSYARPDALHPVLADFEGQEEGGLFDSRVTGYWSIATQPAQAQGASSVEPILRLTNGEPAVVSADVGRGRVILCAHGADMHDTNLPAKPDFVPLALNLAAFAAHDEMDRFNRFVGDPLAVDAVPGGAGEAPVVLTPTAATIPLVPHLIDDDWVLVYRNTEQPGAYRMRSHGRETVFCVNVDPRESDLRRITPSQVKTAFGPKTEVVSPIPEPEAIIAPESARELSPITMLMLIAGLLIESMLATSMGRRA